SSSASDTVSNVSNTSLNGVRPNVTDAMIVSLIGGFSSSTYNNQSGSGLTWTERLDANQAASAGASVAIETAPETSIITATSTASSSLAQVSNIFLVALKPAIQLTSIAPTSGLNNSTSVAITSVVGSAFNSSTSVTLKQAGQSDITCTGFTF